jgi:hypothetical protein
MERELIPAAIEMLKDCIAKNEDGPFCKYRVINSFVEDFNMLEETETMAFEIKRQNAQELLQTLKWFDFNLVQKIEQCLEYV